MEWLILIGILAVVSGGLGGWVALQKRRDVAEGLTLGASRQRIVELFPSTHRRASVTLNRRRIVEIGGGREASSCVEVTPGAAVAVPHRGLRRGELENGRSRNSRRKRTVGSPWWVYTDTYDQSARPRG